VWDFETPHFQFTANFIYFYNVHI